MPLEIFNALNDWAKTLVALVAFLGAVVGFVRWVLPRLRETRKDLRAVRDTLVGRDALRDSITGEQLSPPVPSIGERMARTEDQMGLLAAAVTDLNDAHTRITRVEERVSAIEQGHHMERMAGKVESIQLLKTIETVAEGDKKD